MSLIERLINWPATEQGDALEAGFVSNLMTEAATQLEAMQAFLRRFVEIEAGTEQTGFDPHVEQMLMDLAGEIRASLDNPQGDTKP